MKHCTVMYCNIGYKSTYSGYKIELSDAGFEDVTLPMSHNIKLNHLSVSQGNLSVKLCSDIAVDIVSVCTIRASCVESVIKALSYSSESVQIPKQPSLSTSARCFSSYLPTGLCVNLYLVRYYSTFL